MTKPTWDFVRVLCSCLTLLVSARAGATSQAPVAAPKAGLQPVRVKATTLAKEIEDNALAARLKYVETTLDLEGEIAEIDYEGKVTLVGTAGTSISILLAGGTDNLTAVAALHRGQSVVIRCTVIVKTSAPMFILSSVLTGG